MKTSKILLKAHDLLRTKGWTQGVTLDYTTGHMCLTGALSVAQSGRAFHTLHPHLIEYTKAAIDHDCNIISSWNDEPGRTKAEVLAALDVAASMALSDEAQS